MLKIQEFIRENNTNWRELLSNEPYNLIIKEEDGFVLFKYNQLNSDFSQEICCEARGLILDSTDNFKVVRLAFKKFFNIDEYYASPIDWDTAVATEKIDGSIISIWYARDKWHISTMNNINAFKADLDGITPYGSFGDLVTSILPMEKIEKHLNHRYCYTFELASIYNKVVLEYKEPSLYLLSIRNMETLYEENYKINYDTTKQLGVKLPQKYKLTCEKDYRKIVENMDRTHEGIVVRDANGNRVKIKTLLYLEIHRKINNHVITINRILDLYKTNEHEEFLSYFPEYKDIFDKVIQAYEILKSYVLTAISAAHFYMELAQETNQDRKWLSSKWKRYCDYMDNNSFKFKYAWLQNAYFYTLNDTNYTVDRFLDTVFNDKLLQMINAIMEDKEFYESKRTEASAADNQPL